MGNLIVSMGVSLDGFIYDLAGDFGWSVPSEEQFAFHLQETRALGAHLCGRRLYETMLVWETDPTLRGTDDETAFADTWAALPKIVFSRTLSSVQGHARLARGSVADELVTVRATTDKDIGIGGAGLAATAIEQGLVDEFRLLRHPVIVGGGTPLLPSVTEAIALELVSTRTFGGRVVYEQYRRADG